MCHGKITSRRDDDGCSICGAQVGALMVMHNRYSQHVPLVRLHKFGTSFAPLLCLCSDCLKDDYDFEMAERARVRE